MSYTVGFIGTGEIAHIHAKALQMDRGHWTIDACHDSDPATARRFGGLYRARVCESAEDLLARDLDAVYICTRHDSHVSLAAQACRAGKAVFLEKPLALSLSSARELREVWLRHRVPLAVGYNMRMAPATLRFKQLLREKAVQAESFRASMTGAPFMNSWACDPVQGGGVLVCQGSHMFDLLAHLLGSPVAAVCAHTRPIAQPPELMENSATLLVQLQNGVTGTLLLHDRGSYGYHASPGGRMVNLAVYSPGGTFELDAYSGVQYMGGRAVLREEPKTPYNLGGRWGYNNQAAAFARLLAGGESPLATLEEALQTVAAVEAGRLSAESGGWQGAANTRQ